MVSQNVRLTRPLGEGAMGSVWVADHLTLETEVAVKFISAALASSDPEILTRFVREASLAAKIKSPHVVQTFDQGVMADGTPYIVMERLEGESLQEMIERLDRIDLARTAQIVVQVARALSKAHDLGIVHRDIKPDNIFITQTEDGLFAKVLDFGIAKQTQALPKMGGLTSPGVMVGTPEYMSPEQVLSAKDVDYRADLWALAVTAYYCLTGELPFTAEALGTLCVKLLDGKFTPPSELDPELPPGFDDFFTKALAHAPGDRFENAREMASELVRLARSGSAVIADDLGYGGVTPAHGVPGVVPTAPLPLPSAGGAFAPAATSAPHEAKSETLTGSSSSNRLQPPMKRRSGLFVGAAVGAIALAAIGVGVFALTGAPPPSGDPSPEPAGQTSGQAPPSPTAAPISPPAAEPTESAAAPEPATAPSAAVSASASAPGASSTGASSTAPRPRWVPRPKSPEFPDLGN